VFANPSLTEESEQRRCGNSWTSTPITPMDLADASLVVTAEILRLSRIFTLDSDFYVYRINGVEAFAVSP